MIKPKADVNVTALLAGVATLLVTLGGITATGLIGRLLRNEPGAAVAAFTLLLVGGLMYVFGGLPVTRGRSERTATVLASCLTVIGLGVALVASVRTFDQRGAPQVEIKFAESGTAAPGTAKAAEPEKAKAAGAAAAESGTAVSGKVKVANLSSDRSLTVLVEGLTAGATTSEPWGVTTLAQYYVGPSSGGGVKLPIDVPIPPKTYDAVGIKAWTDDRDTCGAYVRRVVGEPVTERKEEFAGADAACVVVPVPSDVARPKATP